MEKLTIQHLAAYLPFGLMIGQPRLGKIEPYLLLGLNAKSNIADIDDSAHARYMWSYLPGIKPILHPLSDLTKPINHKGETFVPMHWLKNGGTELDEYGFQEWNGYYACDNEEHKTSYDPETKSFYQFYRGESRMCAKQYEKFQKLFEWHIDVFDLIGKGLAIDVNSLDFNPYQDKIK